MLDGVGPSLKCGWKPWSLSLEAHPVGRGTEACDSHRVRRYSLLTLGKDVLVSVRSPSTVWLPYSSRLHGDRKNTSISCQEQRRKSREPLTVLWLSGKPHPFSHTHRGCKNNTHNWAGLFYAKCLVPRESSVASVHVCIRDRQETMLSH